MCKLIAKIFPKLSLVFIIVSSLSIVLMQPAQAVPVVPVTNNKVELAGISHEVAIALTDNYSIALTSFFNKVLLPFYTKEVYGNKGLTSIDDVATSNLQLEDANNTAKSVLEDSEQSIAGVLQGIDFSSARQVVLASMSAGDDSFLNTNNAELINELNPNIKDLPRGNAALDIESLIGTQTYTDETNTNAKLFLAQIEGSSLGSSIIHISSNFKVPTMSSIITIGGIDKNNSFSPTSQGILLKNLQLESDYRAYKNSYRAIIAARSVYLSNLLRSYHERVPSANDGPSALQLRNEQVTKPLGKPYYQAMAGASPTTVARETLFALNRISAQLNYIQQQNERMIVMNAVSGMGQLVLNTKMLDLQAKKVGGLIKDIYCKQTPEGKKDSITCAKDSSGNGGDSGVPDLSGALGSQ